MNDDRPRTLLIVGTPSGRHSWFLSQFMAENEERGVVVEYAFDGAPYNGIRDDFLCVDIEAFNETAHFDRLAFERLDVNKMAEMPVAKERIRLLPPKNLPWYRAQLRKRY